MPRSMPTLLLVSLLIFSAWVGPDEVERWRAVQPSYEAVTIPVLIAHAGGGLPAAAYTNSREAFDLSARNGFCYIETDFRFSRDRKLVLVHEWANAYNPLGQLAIALLGAPNAADFTSRLTRDRVTPLDLPALLEWLELHPAIQLITDTKDDNIRFMRALAPQLDGTMKARFIVQIYSPEELPEARRLGFDQIIFTLYKTSMGDAEVLAFARRERLFAVTMPGARARGDLAKRLAEHGTPVFAHTINTAGEAYALGNNGVTGIYTDGLIPSQRCNPRRETSIERAEIAPAAP
ncbi:MAG: glycerophosphodiester phosphodiesterase family protein [Xanthobacteraceae bacterium]